MSSHGGNDFQSCSTGDGTYDELERTVGEVAD
eukprot:CAMPEP_0194539420 /NCGR_PEP_ID=MMETSP0253-20130528/79377_1 /TAXON_ID=2966 /ORGANISM="Noctiluca scintillans" /LENGTH=31 /DNA_ID= /DNA_START= /DNA_END= /DNA_ORIENTATION=